MEGLHKVAFVLLVIGGLNWLLVGLGVGDVVWMMFGSVPIVAKLIYILVGLSAVLEIVGHKKTCKNCTAPSAPGTSA